MVRIRLSCNDGIPCENHGNDYQSSNTKTNSKKNTKFESLYDPVAVTLVVRNSSLKVLRTVFTEETSFLSFSAEDFSVYELIDGYGFGGLKGSLYSDLYDTRPENVKAKRGNQSCEITPFLFGTTFHRRSVTDDDQLPSESSRYGKEELKSEKLSSPIFLIQMCRTEETKKFAKEKTKKVSVFIDLNNITHKHNPSSNFIRNITYLLTPCSISEIMRNRAVNKIMRENIYKTAKNHLTVPHAADTLLAKSDVDSTQSLSNTVKNTEQNSHVFAMTKINIRLKKCFLDYVCTAVKSRVFVSIGSASFSTTLANNSNGYLLKFSAKDFVLHLSNQIIRNPLFEQNPLDMDGNRSLHHTQNTKSSATHTHYPKPGNTSDLMRNPNQNYKANSENSVLDFDRFLDEHNFIQLVTVDDLNFLASMNLFKPRVPSPAPNAGEGDTHRLFRAVQCSTDGSDVKAGSVQDCTYASSINRSGSNCAESYQAIPLAITEDKTLTAAESTQQTVRTADARAPNSPSNSSVSVEISMGLFCVYVCVDSVDVLAVRTISEV